jgi:hypothetical protein
MYKFMDSNPIIDELTEFIKTERVCCEFFDFGLLVEGDASSALLLTITGPENVKF